MTEDEKIKDQDIDEFETLWHTKNSVFYMCNNDKYEATKLGFLEGRRTLREKDS